MAPNIPLPSSKISEQIQGFTSKKGLKKLLPASSTWGFQRLSHILSLYHLLSEWRWWNYHTPAVRDRQRKNEAEAKREKNTQRGRGIEVSESHRGKRRENPVWRSDDRRRDGTKGERKQETGHRIEGKQTLGKRERWMKGDRETKQKVQQKTDCERERVHC